MNNNLCLRPTDYFIFSFICMLCYFGNAQTSKTLVVEHYEKIEKSNHSYLSKIERINQLLELEKMSIDSLTLSDLYHRYSKLNFRNKDYKHAIIHGKKALEIQKEFTDSLPQLINNTYNNLAYYYWYSEDKTNAIKTFKTLIKQPFKDKFTIRAYAINLAKLLIERGDYYTLLDYLQEAEHTIMKQNNSLLNRELYSVYLSFSNVYSRTNKIEHYYKAIEYLKKTEKTISHLPDQKLIKTKIIINNRYGSIYDELKEYNKAISYYGKALSLSLKTQKKDSLNIAKIYNNLGYIYIGINKPEIAFKYYQNSLIYNPYHTSAFDNLGDYYLNQGSFEQALIHYQKAISFNCYEYDKLNFYELPSIEVLQQSDNKIELVNDLTDKAKAWLQFYTKTKNKEYLEYALTTIFRADELIDIIRSASYEQQSKFFWRKRGVDLYMLATSISYQLNQPENAFYFIEKSKSLSLLENLTHEEAKKLGGLPEVLQEKEHVLKHEILLASQKIIDEISFTKKDRQSLVFKKKRNYEEFLKSLEKEYPNYYNYKKKIDLVSYKETQQKVTETNTVIIQYILSDEEGYGMYIASDTPHLFTIPNVRVLQKEILDLRKLLQRPLFSIKDQNLYKALSFSIFKKLFPFIDTLKLYKKNKKIIIIPDHTLQYLPFETLITNNDNTNIVDNYFINDFEISYLYSISLSKSAEHINKSPTQNLIGFAPIHFEKHKLVDLKKSEEKMKKIQRLFGGNMLTKKNASKSNFIKESSTYKTIHLSTHASSMGNQDPWIAFYDEKLYLNELYFIKTQAELVILDACKTGIGALQPGEGTMSITRGFFHAGAKSVVSSLWNTNEKSNNEIILNFYNYLKKGISKSSALRNAKLDYLKTHQGSEVSPYFWGPLIVQGNIDSIQLSANSQTSLWIYILLSGVLLLITLYLRRKF
ncbi:CHAT domain-containing protein [Aquimarina megaterium]|uniref:CHAT domain-containing protein n=1 Tax=Aquimarina megaterium TaxID=1443666 RepID=UPI00054D6231|nr:CHAT domain-containing protein [Aquimarina megaterium]